MERTSASHREQLGPLCQHELLPIGIQPRVDIGADHQNDRHHGNGRDQARPPQGRLEVGDRQRADGDDQRDNLEYRDPVFVQHPVGTRDRLRDEAGGIGGVGRREARQPCLARKEQAEPDGSGSACPPPAWGRHRLSPCRSCQVARSRSSSRGKTGQTG